MTASPDGQFVVLATSDPNKAISIRVYSMIQETTKNGNKDSGQINTINEPTLLQVIKTTDACKVMLT